MTHQQLGMRSYAPGLGKFRISQFLGKGHLASAYSVEHEAEYMGAPTVLKIALAKDGEGRAASPVDNAVFEHEREVLENLHQSAGPLTRADRAARGRSASVATATAVSQTPAQELFSELDHIPRCVSNEQPLPVLHIQPVGSRLTWFNIRAAHLEQLMMTFQQLHTVHQRFHRDVSYRNILVAPVGWRKKSNINKAKPTRSKPAKIKKKGKKPFELDGSELTSVLLVDWEFSVKIGDTAANEPRTGSAISMSQKQLLAALIADAASPAHAVPVVEAADDDSSDAVGDLLGASAPDTDGSSSAREAPSSAAVPTTSSNFVYGVEDELEATVKSILLILSPALKRRVKQKSATAAYQGVGASQRRYQYLHDIWARVLPEHVFEMCAQAEYDKLATWLKEALFHFDQAEEQEYKSKLLLYLQSLDV